MPRRSYLNSHGEPTPGRFDLRCRPALEHALQRTICAFEHVELRPTFEFGRELLCPARYRRLRRVVHTTIAPRHVTASQASVQPCHAAAPRVPPRHPNRSPPPQSAGRHVPKSWRRSHMRRTASGGFATHHAGSSSKSSMRPPSKISASSGRSSTACNSGLVDCGNHIIVEQLEDVTTRCHTLVKISKAAQANKLQQ